MGGFFNGLSTLSHIRKDFPNKPHRLEGSFHSAARR
jgi:hypothetical protein